MGILAFIIFGLIAGAVAQMLMPGPDPGGRGFKGIAITVGIGILGSFVGGLIGSVLGFGGVTGFNPGSFAIAILGAILFLAAWRAIAKNGSRSTA